MSPRNEFYCSQYNRGMISEFHGFMSPRFNTLSHPEEARNVESFVFRKPPIMSLWTTRYTGHWWHKTIRLKPTVWALRGVGNYRNSSYLVSSYCNSTMMLVYRPYRSISAYSPGLIISRPWSNLAPADLTTFCTIGARSSTMQNVEKNSL